MAGYARGYDALKVAALAVVAVVAFTVLFFFVTNRGLSLLQSDLYVRMPTAEGLRRGDPVFYRGVEVGQVRRISFAPDEDVVVRARLTQPIPLSADGYATLVAVDLFGRQSVVLRDGDFRAARIADGDTLHGTVPPTMAAQLGDLGRHAERITGDTTVALLYAALEGAGEASRGMAALGEELRALLAAQHASLGMLTRDAASVAHNLDAATDAAALIRLRADAGRATASLASTTARLDSAAAALQAVLAGVSSGEGSAGLLLRDAALYERAEALLVSLEALAIDMRQNPGRYLRFSVF